MATPTNWRVVELSGIRLREDSLERDLSRPAAIRLSLLGEPPGRLGGGRRVDEDLLDRVDGLPTLR
jgi:hypothetical protein